MKTETTKQKLDPSPISLREMPEIDFTAYRIRRNPYAARIARENVEVAHREPSSSSLAEMPEAVFRRGHLHPNKYAAKAAAAAAKQMPPDFRVSITNAPGKGVYPISSFTWILLFENPKDKAQSKAMVDFMRWALTEGQKFAPELGYAPLPADVVKLEMAALAKIRTS